MRSPLRVIVVLVTLLASTSSEGNTDDDFYDYVSYCLPITTDPFFTNPQIIVGGGTAGSALAARLSQSLPHHSILLIEAGPYLPDEPKINIPALRGSAIGGPLDWNLTTVPQSATDNRVWLVPRGKVLGGSSALNFMVWNRASVAEYNAWGDLGNPGWDWTSISESMEKSENFTNLNHTEAGFDVRGFEGPIHTTISRYIPEQQYIWRAAMENLGIPRNIDSLSGQPLGVAFQPSCIKTEDYMRSYSANSYLPRAGPNLDFLMNTRVERLNLEGSPQGSFAATGVTIGNGKIIRARQEVILSAGSLQTPGLLELSGIGQKKVLDAAGIDQLIELPGVGENLQDHLNTQVVWKLKDGYSTLDKLKYNSSFAEEQLGLWEKGAYSIYDQVPDGIAMINYKQAFGNDSVLLSIAKEEFGNSTNIIEKKKLEFLADDSVAKIEVVFVDGYLGTGSYPAPGTPDYGNNYLTLVIALMHSLSRGSIHITSSEIAVAPAFDPRYLSNEHDVQALLSIGKLARRIARTEPLASIISDEYDPGLDNVSTEEEWREFLVNSTVSFYHVASTCAMLPREEGGVVDPELRVWGTTNLRVVDASVIPVLIASHAQTAVYAIAEKAANFIIGCAE